MTDQRSGEAVSDTGLRNTILELASGAKIAIEDDGYHGFSYILVRPLPQPENEVFEVLIHRGWVNSQANGGGYTLSDEGLRAYLRSTDELGDGQLRHPHDWEL